MSRAAPIMLKFSWIMLFCTAQEMVTILLKNMSIMLKSLPIMLTLVHVLT